MTADQRQHLETGHAFFAAKPPFANDAARREAWVGHRRQLLDEWDTVAFPGQRPQAMWDFDYPAAVGKYGSEAAAVYELLAGPAEVRRIELAWIREIEIAIVAAARPEFAAELATDRGVPPQFVAKHLPSLAAAAAAEAARHRDAVVVELAAAERTPPSEAATPE